MEAKLIVVEGKASKGAVALKLPAVIGRSREAGLTVAHPMVSRQHCEIFEVDGLLMIRDLGSLNGTVVAGQRISEAPLLPDDLFTVGPLTFRAEYEYDGDLAAVPAPKIIEQEEIESEEEVTGFAAVDATPYDPQSYGAATEQPTPDFAFMEGLDDQAADEPLPDFSTWSQAGTGGDGVGPVEQQTAAESGDMEEEEEEEEEPEPTPPPTAPRRRGPVAEQTVAEPAEDVKSVDESTVESVEESTVESEPAEADAAEDAPSPASPEEKAAEDGPEPQPAGDVDPAKAIQDAKVDVPPDFFAAIDPEASQPAPPEADDEELNDFLKGLQ